MLDACRQIADVFGCGVEMTISANQVTLHRFFLTEADSMLTKIGGKELEIRESQVSIHLMYIRLLFLYWQDRLFLIQTACPIMENVIDLYIYVSI